MFLAFRSAILLGSSILFPPGIRLKLNKVQLSKAVEARNGMKSPLSLLLTLYKRSFFARSDRAIIKPSFAHSQSPTFPIGLGDVSLNAMSRTETPSNKGC